MTPVALAVGGRPAAAAIPPPPERLRNGDNLTRDEFERRYAAMPDDVKAELIDGVVYMPPPASFGDHGRPHFKLGGLLSAYEEATPGVIGFSDASVRLDLGSMPQPDLGLLIDPALGGKTRVDPDGYLSGSPELVVEVAASTASYDLHQKLDAYRRNRVGEYVVWRTLDRQFDRFAFKAGRFRPTPADGDVIRSVAFPGLWLNTAALVAFDSTAAFAELRRGLASPEHAAFAADLARRRAGGGT